VIATDADGGAGLVVARRNGGVVATCAAPVELLLAGQPGAHGPADRSWGLYAGLLDAAGIREPASVDHADVTCGTLRGPRGGLVVVTNHGPAPLRVELHLPAGARAIRAFGPAGVAPLDDGRAVDGGLTVGLALDAHGATIVGWDDPA
jgi:hypothetical protein